MRVGLLLLLAVAACQRPPTLSPHKAKEGHIVGNGGDSLQATFAQGKRAAKRILQRLDAAALNDLEAKGDGLPPSDIAEIKRLSPALMTRIEESTHEWDTWLPEGCPPAHTCGCTLSAKPKQVFLSYQNCRGTGSPRQAGAVLIHEALHALVQASEPQARALTVTAMELWGAFGHPDTPHWKHVSVPESFAHRLRFPSVTLNDEVILFNGHEAARFQVGAEKWIEEPIHFAKPIFDPIFDDPATTAHDRLYVVENRVVSFPNCHNQSLLNDSSGFIYEPKANRVEAVARSPLYSSRYRALQASTGTDLFLWGGEHCEKTPANAHEWFKQGALFSPAKGFRPISNVGAPEASRYARAEWTGKAVLVWGGTETSGGALYDPASDQWKSVSTANQPSPRIEFEMRLTDKGVLIYGGKCFHDPHDLAKAPPCHKETLRDGAIYDVATDRWTRFETTRGPLAGAGGVANGVYFAYQDGLKLFDGVGLKWMPLTTSPYTDSLTDIHYLGNEYFFLFDSRGHSHAALFYP